MKIAVLSGKGGAGKTFVSVNLAYAAGNSVYIDCDVEEPNGRLFFKPDGIVSHEAKVSLPEFDAGLCTGCRKCVEFCRFNAIVYVKNKPLVFPDVCHSCGGCGLVCGENAIGEKYITVGVVETRYSGSVKTVTGILNTGEASAVPVIKETLNTGFKLDGIKIIDCPPGSSCSVMTSVENADFCIITAEPTSFGFHNFKMVYELLRLLKKRFGVVINKMTEPYEPLESFCRDNGIQVLARIPYEKENAGKIAGGEILSASDSDMKRCFEKILDEAAGGNR